MEEFSIRKKFVNDLVDRYHGFSTEFSEWINKTPYNEVDTPEVFDVASAKKKAKTRIIPKAEQLTKEFYYALEDKNLKPFERLVLKNMIDIAEGRIAYTKYMFGGEKNYTIDNLLSDLYGEDFLPRFMKRLNAFEYKRQKDIRNYDANQVKLSEKKNIFEPVKDKVFLDFRKYMLNNMKFEPIFKKVLENGMFKNIILDDIPLGYSFMGSDLYNHHMDSVRMWQQSSNTFLIDTSYMASTIFHEFAGHLGRECYSENLPSALTYTSNLNYTLAMHPLDEGLSYEFEGEARTFSKLRNTLFLVSRKGNVLKASKLTPEEKKESDKAIQFGMKQNFFYRYFMMNVLRLKENPEKNISDEVAHFTGKKVPRYASKDIFHPLNWGRNPLGHEKKLMNEGELTITDEYLLPYWMGYPKGIMFMNDFKRMVDRKHGRVSTKKTTSS